MVTVDNLTKITTAAKVIKPAETDNNFNPNLPYRITYHTNEAKQVFG
jgi:hypothetical protein